MNVSAYIETEAEMAETWEQATMGDVKAGDRIRLPSGRELQVSEIETPFFGMAEMVAFIESTETSWFKQPGRRDTPVEIYRV